MAFDFSQDQKGSIFTNAETTEALLNQGYTPEYIYGFYAVEIMELINTKYKGDINIVFKKNGCGFVAMFNDNQVFDSASFDPCNNIINALAQLLLILDNRLDLRKTNQQQSQGQQER
jgi:putative methionine-R-sulfoxide reductase with GAF domain